MKKILIISGNNHTFTSGADMYTSRIISILKKQGCSIDEYSFEINISNKDNNKEKKVRIISPNKTFNDCNGSKLKWLIKNIYNVVYRSRRQLDKLIKDYDLIIDASLLLVRSKKLLNSDKYLYIQHQNIDFFEMKRYGILTPIAFFLIRAAGFKNCFKMAKNIVFYDEKNKKYIEDKYKFKDHSKYFTIINSNLTRKTIEKNKKIKENVYKTNEFYNDINYIGRITKEQKRMNDVDKIFRRTNTKLDAYGFGTYASKLSNNPNINYHGKIEHKDVLSTNSHSKFSLLFSDYEGLSTSMVESICSLTPIIIRDSHHSAKFLVDNNKNGFLLKNKSSIREYAKIIDEINELPMEKLKELSDNCYKFAIENLLFETFEKKWIDVYHEMTK
ncbi:MAG: glycosyltransferase [Mycoplasmataceae bacterium]|nr:glycosyltransferase [Mycoplasmataceae bacterium]